MISGPEREAEGTGGGEEKVLEDPAEAAESTARRTFGRGGWKGWGLLWGPWREQSPTVTSIPRL